MTRQATTDGAVGRSLAEIRKELGGDWETPESIGRADQIEQLWAQARREQRWVPDAQLPLAYVEAVYVAYEFARQHVDRESAMRHANRSLEITTRAADDWLFDIGMTLVRDLCATFDRARTTGGGE